MMKCKFSFGKLIPAIFILPVFFSCNNKSEDIPFPEKEFGYAQPVTVPLQFSKEKKLTWDTAKKGGVHPVIKNLAIETLPSEIYDTTGFKPFAKAPEEVKFDFNSLPDTVFSLDALPSKPLQFKIAVLPPPAFIKTQSPAVQKGNPLSIFDFGPKQGFPATFVTALLKDKNGLMWIASREGLFRYDGNQIQTYIPGGPQNFIAGMVEDDFGRIWFIDQTRAGMIDPYKGTISSTPIITVDINNVCKIIKDKNGQIWISKTSAKEVIIIDPATQTFKRLSRSAGLSDAGGANDITEDGNGNIWVTTPFGGANIINPNTKKITYLKKNNGLVNDTLRAITTDHKGQIWIASTAGRVDAINVQQGTIQHYNGSQGLKPAFVSMLSADNSGKIWVGKNTGVDVLDPENGSDRFIDDTRGLGTTGLRFVTSCIMDNNKRMWVSTVGGLHIIDQNGETVNPLGATSIISLMEDTVGNLWIATQQGVKIIDAKKTVIRRLDKSNGLSDDFVQTFSKFNQQMWVTTDGGLDIVDPIRKTMEHLGKKEGLVNDTIYVVLKDKIGNIWLTGPSNGIDLIDAAKQTILHTDIAGGLSDNNILDAKEDQEGLIWLAGNTGGVNIVDFKTGIVKYLNNQPGLKDTCSKMMLVDQYGRIWIGTDKGIYVADKKLGTLTALTVENGLTSNRILSLLQYKGSVLAGTSKKVSIITAPTPPYAANARDSSKNKWTISLLDKSEGLIRETTNSWSTDGITGKGQYLWGDNGMTVIYDIEANKQNPLIYVTGMNVMNKPQYFANKILLNDKDSLWVGDSAFAKGQTPVNTGYTDTKTFNWDSVSAPFNMPVNLTIPYDKNYIQFQFAEAHLSRPEPASYTYVLEGIDKNWSLITTNTFTENYLNLPPGKYTFKVSSKGINGKWNTPASFHFTITPPWYKTWWAYALYALLFAGVLRAYIVFRSRQLQKENRLLEEKVNLRTKQLQESIEDLKATQSQLVQSEKMASLGELTAGIAHEIQNPLNFINNFSEVNTELIEEMKTELKSGNTDAAITIADDISANEQKINHHGKRADSIVKGMLQHSRSSNGIKEPTNINALADEYLRLAYHGLRAKDKSFNAVMKTDFDESIGNIKIIPQDIGRVILNLITNAFYVVTEKKHQGIKSYEPTVTVSTKKKGELVEITVADNGNGIPKKVLDKIFQPFFTTKPAGLGTGLGLSMSYDIVTKGHGGELKVETKEGEGSQFIIILPA